MNGTAHRVAFERAIGVYRLACDTLIEWLPRNDLARQHLGGRMAVLLHRLRVLKRRLPEVNCEWPVDMARAHSDATSAWRGVVDCVRNASPFLRTIIDERAQNPNAGSPSQAMHERRELHEMVDLMVGVRDVARRPMPSAAERPIGQGTFPGQERHAVGAAS